MNSRDSLRMTLQVKNTGRPVFIPFVFALAARIEQVPLIDMVTDPTYYANLLDGAQKLLHYDAIITGFDSSLEHEIFSCRPEWKEDYEAPLVASWTGCRLEDASIENSGRVHVMLEATRRLVATCGKDVGIIGVITGPCSLAASITANAGSIEDYSLPSAIATVGTQLTKLTRSVCETKADAIIFREDELASSFPVSLVSPDDACTAIYATLFNLARFYNVAALVMVRGIGPDGIEDMVKMLQPDGVILSGVRLDAGDLAILAKISETKKVSIGLPIQMNGRDAMLTDFRLFTRFASNSRPGGFFYTSDTEVPHDIALEEFRDLVAEIKSLES